MTHLSAPALHIRLGAGAMRLTGRALAWAAMMAVSALFALLQEQGRDLSAHTIQILALYFAGGFIAFVAAALFIAWAGKRMPKPFAFAFTSVTLTLATLGATAGVLALDYRAYYAQWHDVAFSKLWFYEQFYTALGSTYQYLVLGTRLYWPFGPVFLILMSWWLVRRTS